MPKQSKSHRLEVESKLGFEAAIFPWIVNWTIRDYATDGLIDICHTNDGEYDDLINLKFCIQLKASSIIRYNKQGNPAFELDTSDIVFWCRGNIPYLIILFDSNTKTCFYKWADTDLVNLLNKKNPIWKSQKTVTIDFSKENIINKEVLHDLEDYVYAFKKSAKAILIPGTYFNFKSQLLKMLNVAKENFAPSNFLSVNKLIDEQYQALDQTMYRVTVAGKSKAGKSTFINAFLKKKISPVDILPITGVPISFFPNKKDEAIIHFSDGKPPLYGEATDKFIEDYTSKEKNKGNKHCVKQINVNLINEQLEQGVSFFDVPGLDDLEVTVQNYSWSTIGQSNAIIYLIDIAPYEYGSSFIDGEIIKDLKRLISSNNIDKVFIVFNKLNAIKTKPIDRLKNHIALIFEEQGIAKYIHSKQFYIDSEESFESRTSKPGKKKDHILELEEELWKYLLAENKLGIYKFQKVITDLSSLTSNYLSAATLVVEKSNKKTKLLSQISEVKSSFPALKSKIIKKRNELIAASDTYLDARFSFMMANLKEELIKDEVKSNEDWIKQYLQDQTKITLKALNEYVGKQLLEQKNEMDEWVEDNLRKIRNVILGDNKKYVVDLTGLKEFKLSDIDDINVALGFLNIGVVLMLAVEFPPIALLIGLLSLLGWSSSKEDRRKNRIDKIVLKINPQYQKITTDIKAKSTERISSNIQNMQNYAIDRVNLFINDLEKEIADLAARNMNAETKLRIEKSIKKAESLKEQITQSERALRYYY